MPLLTDRERRILELNSQGFSDYKIARILESDPPTITRSRKNALRKLAEAQKTLTWAETVLYITGKTKEMAR